MVSDAIEFFIKHGYPCVAQTWDRLTPDLLDRARKLALKTLAPKVQP